MNPLFSARLLAFALILAHSTAIASRASVERDFQVVKRGKYKESGKPVFYLRTLRGTERPDGQWFVPQDPTHIELKVHGLTRFTPFRPITPAGQ